MSQMKECCLNIPLRRGSCRARSGSRRCAAGPLGSERISLSPFQFRVATNAQILDSGFNSLILTSLVFDAMDVLLLQNLRLQFLMNKTPGLRARSIRTIASRGDVTKWDFEMTVSQANIPKNKRGG